MGGSVKAKRGGPISPFKTANSMKRGNTVVVRLPNQGLGRNAHSTLVESTRRNSPIIHRLGQKHILRLEGTKRKGSKARRGCVISPDLNHEQDGGTKGTEVKS